MNIPIDPRWLESTLLASVRMAMFIIIAPPFSSRAFPGMVKAILSVGLGVAVSGTVEQSLPSLTDAAFYLALVEQLTIGAALGFLVYLVFAAIESAGSLIDLFGGFQISQAFDPTLSLNGAAFARLFQMAAVALMFSSGAYQIVLAGLARTFVSLPVGAGFPATITAADVAAELSGMFVAAVQIAGPLIIVLVLADIGLGLLTKVAPALNAFSMSYPIKMTLSLALGGVVFVALPAAIASMTGAAVALIGGGHP
ncbi:flagellar biosynthetic protein FliR [Gryllotalpicola sp.]|uniref:flagellar biosynthetic protein FliR n=1 Tax=Gryllotalpicola sp. TaxID=1932787 RepID=UPI00260C1FED|nr:flagellar biosynthetic protein FliR [Gryllotalpicola sp.]